jgi:CDP-diacylglycerol---serine O-phosphatidyltransferase
MNDRPREDEDFLDAPFSSFDPDGDDQPVDEGRGPRLRDISFRMMIPTVITILAICAGLTGIRLAFEGRFELAVVMVLLAAFLDGIDGRVARLMKSSSKFGAQMDSLADIINFGVAPALVLYAFLLDRVSSFGWIAALIYVLAAALRLARFNVMDERPAKAKWQSNYFVGVPAPLGALLVMLPIYLGFLGLQPGGAFAMAAMMQIDRSRPPRSRPSRHARHRDLCRVADELHLGDADGHRDWLSADAALRL